MSRRSNKEQPTARNTNPRIKDEKPAQGATPRFRGWRGWLLRLTLLVCSPILFFGLLEAGLRLGGYGYPTEFFLGPDAKGACATNNRFGWRFFPRSLAQEPHPYNLAAKPPGSIRIFVLGESAAMGTPEPAFSFGRILAVMLREQYPDTKFEVVNAAITAINSYTIYEIARDCATHHPDLFVVYMGNNEVIGPYGPGTVFQGWSPSLSLIRSSLWVKSTRVGELLGDGFNYFRRNQGTADHWRGMEMFMNNPVAADDPRMATVYDNYRRNLTDICQVARRAGAGVVLCTMAVNLRDCPPLASLHRSALTAEDLAKWKSLYDEGVKLEASQQTAEALYQYEAAAKIDDRFAELQFRIARCLMKSGRFDEARQRFELARDLDVLRFRADTRLNTIVRELAGGQAAAGTRLADTERALGDSNPEFHGIPGGDIFYEHVHLTFDGNYLLARTVFDQVCESLPQLANRKKLDGAPSRQRCAELLPLTLWDEQQMAATMVEMTSRPPFTNQLDHDFHQEEACRRRDELGKQASTPQAIQTAWQAYESALAKAPDDWDLHRRFGMLAMQFGQPSVAVQQFRIALEEMPWDAVSQGNLGNALASFPGASAGQIDEAIVHFRKALEIKPDFTEVQNNLGNALAGRGQVDEAIAHFQKALEINFNFAAAHNNLGNVLAGRGQLDQAIAHFRKAVEIKPDYAAAQHNLGLMLVRDPRAGGSRIDEAISHYVKAAEIDPQAADIQFDLAGALQSRGRLDEATARYRKALDIDPTNVRGQVRFADALAGHGEVDEAIIHYRKSLELKPDDLDAHNNLGLALAGRGHVDDAIAEYEKALAIKADYAPAHNNLGMALAGRQHYDQAIAHYEKAIAIKPDYAEAHNNLGVALAAGHGQMDAAIIHFQKALELKPDYVGARQNLEHARSKR